MAVEISGAICRIIIVWIVICPSLGLAQPPQQNETERPSVEERAGVRGMRRARFAPLSLDGLTLSKRGIEYRSAFVLKRRQVPFRVWGGRKSKRPALGIDFEPTMRNGKLRAGAYASGDEFGFAIRIRY